jgi:hypothetical protein
LRPEYLRPWLANPNSILPYTNMPVNFKHDAFENQKLFHGTSTEQLEAVVDLLLNYDRLLKNRTDMKKIVKEHAPPPMATPMTTPAPAAGGGD